MSNRAAAVDVNSFGYFFSPQGGQQVRLLIINCARPAAMFFQIIPAPPPAALPAFSASSGSLDRECGCFFLVSVELLFHSLRPEWVAGRQTAQGVSGIPPQRSPTSPMASMTSSLRESGSHARRGHVRRPMALTAPMTFRFTHGTSTRPHGRTRPSRVFRANWPPRVAQSASRRCLARYTSAPAATGRRLLRSPPDTASRPGDAGPGKQSPRRCRWR